MGGAPATCTTMLQPVPGGNVSVQPALPGTQVSGGNRAVVNTATSLTGALPPVLSANAPVVLPVGVAVGEPILTWDKAAAPLNAFKP